MSTPSDGAEPLQASEPVRPGGAGAAQPWASPAADQVPAPAAVPPAVGWGQPSYAGWGAPPPGAPPRAAPPAGAGVRAAGVGWAGAGGAGVGWAGGGGFGVGAPEVPAPGAHGTGVAPGVTAAGNLWRRGPAKPGIVPLRPLGLGELYDGAFQAMRRNPRTMLGASAVVNVVTTAVGLALLALSTGSLTRLLDLSSTGASPVDDSELAGALGGAGLGFLGLAVVTGFGTAVLTGVLTFAVGRAVLGEKLGPGRLWRMVRPRLVAIVVLQLLFGLVYLLLGLVTLGPGIGLLFVEPVVGGVVLALGVLVLAVTGLLTLVTSSMATPAMLLEEASIWRAFVRGWRIVRMSFWRTTGIMVLTAGIAYAMSTALALPSSALGFVYTAVNPDDPRALAGVHPVQLVINGVFTSVSSTIVLPFLAGVATLLYIDVRMRREGLDVELATAAA